MSHICYTDVEAAASLLSPCQDCLGHAELRAYVVSEARHMSHVSHDMLSTQIQQAMLQVHQLTVLYYPLVAITNQVVHMLTCWS